MLSVISKFIDQLQFIIIYIYEGIRLSLEYKQQSQ